MQSRECPSPTSNWDHPFLLAKSFGTPNLVVLLVHTSKVARVRSASKEAFFLTFPIITGILNNKNGICTRNLSFFLGLFSSLSNYMKRIGHDYLYLYKAYLFDFHCSFKGPKKRPKKEADLRAKKG